MDEREADILIERALFGGDRGSEAEPHDAWPDAGGSELDGFDMAVGATTLAMLDEVEEMPADLAISLRSLGRGFVAASGVRSATGQTSVAGTIGPEVPSGPVSGSGTLRIAAGWIAAAACLAFAFIWRAAPVGGPEPLTASQRLASLESTATDLIRATWAGMSAIGAPDHDLDSGVSGEIVWSDDADEGYMLISGIEPNDPDEFQYQLWIFDAERRTGDLPQFRAEGLPEILTQRPIDGGVFDVPAGGEALIPVDPKLPVGEGVIFAVTKERPGGVVVSDRDIVFLALRG